LRQFKKKLCKKNETLLPGNEAWFATRVGELAVTSVYEDYPEIKNKNEEGKGNHRCEGGNTAMSSRTPIIHLLLHIKKQMAGQTYNEDEEVKNEATAWLRAHVAEFCDIGIQNLIPRLNKCLDRGGDYV
jgi:hypothetical protein